MREGNAKFSLRNEVDKTAPSVEFDRPIVFAFGERGVGTLRFEEALGFTLIELLVVIAIIAILAALASAGAESRETKSIHCPMCQ